MTERIAGLNASLEALVREGPDLWRISAWGVTRGTQSIPALLHNDAYLPETNRTRVLLVSGFSGEESDVALALGALQLFQAEGIELAGRIALSGVPCVNPERNGGLSPGYPPLDNFFNDPQEPESRYLWRWVCFQAPGLVLELRAAGLVQWQANDAATALGSALGARTVTGDGSWLAAIGEGTPDGLGPIPGLRLSAPPDHLATELGRLWTIIANQDASASVSPARRALDARRGRSFRTLREFWPRFTGTNWTLSTTHRAWASVGGSAWPSWTRGMSLLSPASWGWWSPTCPDPSPCSASGQGEPIWRV